MVFTFAALFSVARRMMSVSTDGTAMMVFLVISSKVVFLHWHLLVLGYLMLCIVCLHQSIQQKQAGYWYGCLSKSCIILQWLCSASKFLINFGYQDDLFLVHSTWYMNIADEMYAYACLRDLEKLTRTTSKNVCFLFCFDQLVIIFGSVSGLWLHSLCIFMLSPIVILSYLLNFYYRNVCYQFQW